MNLPPGNILISIPHCSPQLPTPLRDRLLLTELQLKRDTDLLTDQLFACGKFPILKASYSRYLVDLNRSEKAEGEKGIIVTTDFDNCPIYHEGDIPSLEERQERIEKYWRPFHHQLEQHLKSPTLQFFIDAHSMRPVGSAKTPDPFEERADIVLSNLGSTTGTIRPEIGYLSCSWEWLLKAAEILENLWRPHPLEIAFNDPYYGGYIIGHYTNPNWQGHKPGFQIEINRKLYLNWDTQQPLPNKILELRQKFEQFLERFLQMV